MGSVKHEDLYLIFGVSAEGCEYLPIRPLSMTETEHNRGEGIDRDIKVDGVLRCELELRSLVDR
jgi:hypothetical protein